MISKFLLSALFAVLALSVSAQKPIRKGVKPQQKQYMPATARYQISQLNGKWQEISRVDRSNKPVQFSDTLQMIIRGMNGELREGNSMNMSLKGQARITAPANLEIAGDTYSIISSTTSSLTIDDGEYLRRLDKRKNFYYESLGKTEIRAEEFSVPIITDLHNLKGKWSVYKTNAKPGYMSKEPLIRALDIRSDSVSRYAVGEISFSNNDMIETRPVRISFEGNDMVIQTLEGMQWKIYLYKASGNELVFGKQGEVIYYAKP